MSMYSSQGRIGGFWGYDGEEFASVGDGEGVEAEDFTGSEHLYESALTNHVSDIEVN
jgi:hypothetical protein